MKKKAKAKLKLKATGKTWKEDLEGLVPLEYIRFQGVPMRSSEHGPIIDLPPQYLELLAAKAVIRERIPLRGRELRFLRKTLGLSLEKFAHKLGLTSGCVLRWEQKEEQRLAPINEAAVRTLAAEELGVEISGKFSELIGSKERELCLRAS